MHFALAPADGELSRVLARARETLIRYSGDPGDASAVRAAAAGESPGRYPALTAGELLLLASTERWPPGPLRALNCPASDPVSFALLRGVGEARFPAARGWSVSSLAERAVAEHRRRLEMEPRAAGLLAAARAAVLWESLRSGTPVLAVTPAAAAGMLGDLRPWVREAAAACARGDPSPAALTDLRSAVAGLASYGGTRVAA